MTFFPVLLTILGLMACGYVTWVGAFRESLEDGFFRGLVVGLVVILSPFFASGVMVYKLAAGEASMPFLFFVVSLPLAFFSAWVFWKRESAYLLFASGKSDLKALSRWDAWAGVVFVGILLSTTFAISHGISMMR